MSRYYYLYDTYSECFFIINKINSLTARAMSELCDIFLYSDYELVFMQDKIYDDRLRLGMECLVRSEKDLLFHIVDYVTMGGYIDAVNFAKIPRAFERCIWVPIGYDVDHNCYHYDWINASIPVWWDEMLREPVW